MYSSPVLNRLNSFYSFTKIPCIYLYACQKLKGAETDFFNEVRIYAVRPGLESRPFVYGANALTTALSDTDSL